MLGLLGGDGVGPELVGHCARIAELLLGERVKLRWGPSLEGGYSAEVDRFLRDVFAAGGAVLSGPGGGRYVYLARQALPLPYKISPLHHAPTGVDMLVVRHTGSGLFQSQEVRENGRVRVSFEIPLDELTLVGKVAWELSQQRGQTLTLAMKPYGQPLLAQLWRDALESVGAVFQMKESDWVAYQMLRYPQQLGVVLCQDEIGDLLCDLGGQLMESRGCTYGACFTHQGRGLYQTNHGAAYDLVGTDRVNPTGQLLSLAWLLQQSLGFEAESRALFGAIEAVRQQVRTEDVPGALPLVSTSEWVERLAHQLKVAVA